MDNLTKLASKTRSSAQAVSSLKRKKSPNGEDTISASKAKTHLLELLDNVDRRRQSLTITKRGRAIAKLVPIEVQQATDVFGCMKGTFRITGDVVGPEPDVWEAMS
jgi:prevent-host-death family protein